MVLRTEKPMDRAAACCSFGVVKGGAGFCRRSRASTVVTRRAEASTCALTSRAASLVARRGSVPSNWSLSPRQRTTRAGKAAPSFASVTGTEKYGTGTKASRSVSRSTMIRSATVCTRPADRPRQTLFQSSSETS